MGYTPQAALGAVLVAGVLFLIISLTPIRAWLIKSIPKSLKLRDRCWYWIIFSNYWTWKLWVLWLITQLL